MSIAEAGTAPGSRPRLAPGGAPLAIEATGLAKRFGPAQAVAGVELAVAAGHCVRPARAERRG